jgi:hypothetical protein
MLYIYTSGNALASHAECTGFDPHHQQKIVLIFDCEYFNGLLSGLHVDPAPKWESYFPYSAEGHTTGWAQTT